MMTIEQDPLHASSAEPVPTSTQPSYSEQIIPSSKEQTHLLTKPNTALGRTHASAKVQPEGAPEASWLPVEQARRKLPKRKALKPATKEKVTRPEHQASWQLPPPFSVSIAALLIWFTVLLGLSSQCLFTLPSLPSLSSSLTYQPLLPICLFSSAFVGRSVTAFLPVLTVFIAGGLGISVFASGALTDLVQTPSLLYWASLLFIAPWSAKLTRSLYAHTGRQASLGRVFRFGLLTLAFALLATLIFHLIGAIGILFQSGRQLIPQASVTEWIQVLSIKPFAYDVLLSWLVFNSIRPLRAALEWVLYVPRAKR